MFLRVDLYSSTYGEKETVVFFDGATASKKSNQDRSATAGDQNQRPRADKWGNIKTSGVANLSENEDFIIVEQSPNPESDSSQANQL